MGEKIMGTWNKSEEKEENKEEESIGKEIWCSICLEIVTPGGDRSTAQLKYGHDFHLENRQVLTSSGILEQATRPASSPTRVASHPGATSDVTLDPRPTSSGSRRVFSGNRRQTAQAQADEAQIEASVYKRRFSPREREIES